MLTNKYTDYVEQYITNKNENIINFDGDVDGDGFPSFEPTEFDYSSLYPTFNPTFDPTVYFVNNNNINNNNNNLDSNQIILITFLTIGPLLLIIILFKYKKYILSNYFYNNFYKNKKNKDLKMDQFGVEINNIYHDIECGNNDLD